MKRMRWAIVAVVMLVALLPAVGQGKANLASLYWSLPGRHAPSTSYTFLGPVAGGSTVVRGFRLGNWTLTKSGRLAIRLTGSSAFSVRSNHCTGKSVGPNLSCWVGVAYTGLGAGTNDSATLTATGAHGAAASISLSGCSPSGPNDVYWSAADLTTVNGVPLSGGCVTTLAADQDGPVGVAVDGTNVYWITSGGAVDKVPRSGGRVTTLAYGQFSGGAIAVDGTDLYFLAGGKVEKVPIGGGPVTALTGFIGYTSPGSMAVDVTHVYWVDYLGGTVNEVPLGGGAVTTLASGQTFPWSLAVDGTNVYWVNQGTTYAAADGSVNAVPVGGGSVTTLASGQAYPSAVAVDGTNVYWADWGGPLNEIPVGGGSVTELAYAGYAPSMAVDSTHVYWGDRTSVTGGIHEVSLGGGPATTLARFQSVYTRLAIGP